MNISKLLGVFAIVLVIILGMWLYKGSMSTTNEEVPEESAENENTSLGMYAEENALVPTDQRPGNSVSINRALLNQPGYVVVHEESDGQAGAILGSSTLLPKGEHSRVSVTLSRPARDGETLYVMIHAEGNNNQTFEAASDPAVQGSQGDSIMASFHIDVDADTSIEVMP